jgi:hypothetical protein
MVVERKVTRFTRFLDVDFGRLSLLPVGPLIPQSGSSLEQSDRYSPSASSGKSTQLCGLRDLFTADQATHSLKLLFEQSDVVAACGPRVLNAAFLEASEPLGTVAGVRRTSLATTEFCTELTRLSNAVAVVFGRSHPFHDAPPQFTGSIR